MYLPPQFDARDRATALALMREHAFASLVTVDDDGLPFITHLPTVVADGGDGDGDGDGDGAPVVWCHCARPNPQWRHLQARPRARLVFQGPHAYMSPAVYPDLARVPTWNYLAVHCVVEARLVDAPEEKDALLKRLIAQHEPAYARQWAELGPEFQRKMLAGIMGLELRVTQIQCKLKLNQHRAESHAALYAAYAGGTPDEQALAGWMRRLGMAPGTAPREG